MGWTVIRVMHIVATGQRRGAERFASSLVRALGRIGTEQRVVLLRSGDGPHVAFDAPVAVPSRRLLLAGVRVDAAAVASIRRANTDFRPDVVQAHGGQALKHALVATAGKGERIVYRRIGDARQFGESRVRERAYAALMRRCARVVAVADALRAELIERFGLDPARVVAIPNGIDRTEFQPGRDRAETRASLGIADDARVVLSLGALTWEKDPIAHLEVVSRVAADRSNVVHVIAGDGPLRPSVEAEVRRLPASDRTRIVGSREDVGDLLAASDVVLLASRTEGMPASAIEAGMAGVPVVAYRVSGIPEVVIDGETGILAPPGDTSALARALGDVLGDDERRRVLGSRAAAGCRDRFDIGEVARRYLDVYEEVAAAVVVGSGTRGVPVR